MLFGIIPLALSALLMVCAIARRSAERRAAAAAQAAAEQAAAMKKAQAEAARRAAQDRAAAAEAARRAAAEQKKQAAAQKKQERERHAAEAHALKVARAAELAELAERRLQAEKELVALRQAAQQAAQQPQEQPSATPDDHSETPAEQAQEPKPQQPAAPVLSLDQFAQAAAPAPQPFKGQTVAFTGRLTISGMTHAQAREKVKQAGGTAFEKEMPSFTTLLIVGENPGMKKLDKADTWIGNVRKMTEQQFLDMLASA